MNKARFVLSRSGVLERYGFLREACPVISYSMKTNPDVGSILDRETDCFFSIHTPEGLGWVSDIKRVWYLAEGLDKTFFRRLLIYGVENFVVDNEDDLRKLEEVLEEGRWKVRLLLRMRFQETTIYKGRYFLFGMTPYEINRRIPELRKNPHITKLGIHFHRKSQNTGNWNLRYMLEEMLSQ